uniref:Uncharacterized protein n=1 Tax=Romanomermis culicivorax TaxID=13658 RepID=A0A915KU09_ROMCU
MEQGGIDAAVADIDATIPASIPTAAATTKASISATADAAATTTATGTAAVVYDDNNIIEVDDVRPPTPGAGLRVSAAAATHHSCTAADIFAPSPKDDAACQ